MSMQQINLLNPQLLTPQVAFSARTIASTLLLVVVLGLALYGAVVYKARDTRQQLDQVQAKRDALQAKIDALAVPSTEAQASEDRMAQAVAVEKKRIDRLKTLDAALSGKPGAANFSERLRALAREPLPGVWLTGIEMGEQGFRLEGRALQTARIPDYLALLSRQPALKDLPLAGFSIAQPEADGDLRPPGVRFMVGPAEAAK